MILKSLLQLVHIKVAMGLVALFFKKKIRYKQKNYEQIEKNVSHAYEPVKDLTDISLD